VTNRHSAGYRASNFALLFLVLASFLGACGGSSGSSQNNGNPAPFDTAKGEGKLLSAEVVVTYPTGPATVASADGEAPMDLQSFYVQTICPSSINPADCTHNQASLNTPIFGNFDLSRNPIANNPLGITAVDAVKITYGAINVGGAPVTVSGGIAIPNAASESIKGIILFFHGTTTQRTNVPSNFITPDNSSGDPSGATLAAVWASQGYVVVMPDYIGLGDDTADPHPYVIYPQENAQSGLAMVLASRTFLEERVKKHVPLFVTGYSEGGGYALEAGRLMQENPRYAKALKVSLTDVVPISGAYDLTGTMLPYLFFNISDKSNPWFSFNPGISALSKPFLSADLALSFSHYQNVAATEVMAQPFYDCAGQVKPMCGSSGTLDGLYYESGLPDITVLLATVAQASQTSWTPNDNNSIEPLLTSAYAQALMNGDPNNPLYARLLAADTYQFIPAFRLAMVSLSEDSVVTPVNTHVAFSFFTTQNPAGPYQEFLVSNGDFIVPSILGGTDFVDHLGELPFLAVLALNQFNLNR
jgi:hypothetical protein